MTSNARGRKTPLYTYQVANEAGVKSLFELLKPYLSSVKKEQFIDRLASWEARDVKWRRV